MSCWALGPPIFANLPIVTNTNVRRTEFPILFGINSCKGPCRHPFWCLLRILRLELLYLPLIELVIVSFCTSFNLLRSNALRRGPIDSNNSRIPSGPKHIPESKPQRVELRRQIK